MTDSHAKGLHELGNGLCAYSMLEQMKPITASNPIDRLVNTRANGDHCFGNELVPGRAKIYATVATTEETAEYPAAGFDQPKRSGDLGPARTASDSVAAVEGARTVFTRDLAFIRGTPVAWQVRRYFEFVLGEARKGHAAGKTGLEAAYDTDLGEYAELGDAERTVVTVDRAYTDIDPQHTQENAVTLFGEMASCPERKMHSRLRRTK